MVGWGLLGSTIQRPVDGVLVPVRTIFPAWITVMRVASKCAVHPASHRVPTDKREAPGKVGKMWALRAWVGTCAGRMRSQVWVDVVWRPSGILTEIGMVDGCLFVWGVLQAM